MTATQLQHELIVLLVIPPAVFALGVFLYSLGLKPPPDGDRLVLPVALVALCATLMSAAVRLL